MKIVGFILLVILSFISWNVMSEEVLSQVLGGLIVAAIALPFLPKENQQDESIKEANRTDTDGMSELMYAAYLGKLKSAKDLVNRGADVNSQDERGYSALMIASREGYYDIVEHLISCNANTKLTDRQGLTAEMHAEEHGHMDIVRLFEKHASSATLDQV